MWGHLTDERLLDLVEGRADSGVRAHADTCARCGDLVESARAGLGLAREADALPEPSPLYWEAFRRQVDRQIVAVPPVRSWGWRPALASAAAVLALLVALPPAMRPSAPKSEQRSLPAWSALPASAEDDSLVLIGELEPSEELVSPDSPRLGIAGAVEELTDAEQQQLAAALQTLLQSERRTKKS